MPCLHPVPIDLLVCLLFPGLRAGFHLLVRTPRLVLLCTSALSAFAGPRSASPSRQSRVPLLASGLDDSTGSFWQGLCSNVSHECLILFLSFLCLLCLLLTLVTLVLPWCRFSPCVAFCFLLAYYFGGVFHRMCTIVSFAIPILETLAACFDLSALLAQPPSPRT